MECRHCASPLEKPGDFCLVCREANTEAIVLEAARDRATITMLAGEPDEPTERDPETDRDELHSARRRSRRRRRTARTSPSNSGTSRD